MRDHGVPDHVREGVRRVTDTIDDLRTTRIRLGKAAEEHAARHPRPERPEPAARLRQAAMRRDAPIELVRLARAVQDGRTTWQAVVTGQADALPEVAAVQARARAGMARLREPKPETPRPADPEDDAFTSIYDR